MNWDQIEGNWMQLKGTAKSRWGKLTDDQLEVIAGKREQLIGRIQEAYGITRETTERQIAQWQADQREPRMVPEADAVKPPELKDVQ